MIFSRGFFLGSIVRRTRSPLLRRSVSSYDPLKVPSADYVGVSSPLLKISQSRRHSQRSEGWLGGVDVNFNFECLTRFLSVDFQEREAKTVNHNLCIDRIPQEKSCNTIGCHIFQSEINLSNHSIMLLPKFIFP